MVRRVPDCMGCDMPGCIHCTTLELTCDGCEEQVEKLYDFKGEQLCEDCYKNAAFDDAKEVDYESVAEDE